jgi:hypothetical protein
VSFCTHAVAADDLLVILEARRDACFANNSMVVETRFVHFYAGVPLSELGQLNVADEDEDAIRAPAKSLA